jgi:hypothetical protein
LMRRVTDDDPRWRQSAYGYGCNAAKRMDPPPRSLARRRMTASWSAPPIRVQPNTSVVRAINRGQWQAPLGSSRGQTTRSSAVCRRTRVGQEQAFGGAEEAPSLTAAARDGDGNMAVGAEECSRRGSNKRMNKQGAKKWCAPPLTKKAPYKCPNWARTDLCRGTSASNPHPYPTLTDFERWLLTFCYRLA